MRKRSGFIIIFVTCFAGLAWWTKKLDIESPRSIVSTGKALPALSREAQAIKRREVIEVLDRLVAYEHHYRSIYGHFTKLLARIGFSIPRSISDLYEIHVVEASSERLLVTASSEINGRTLDVISVNQNFEINANFSLPEPRVEYLKFHALKRLRASSEKTADGIPGEGSVYRGYFLYEKSKAVGIRAPVLGIEVSMADASGAGGYSELAWDAPTTGEKTRSAPMSTLEQAYLAQRIFRSEIGRYAKTWTELSQIAAFPFEDRERYGIDAVPFGEHEPQVAIRPAELRDEFESRAVASENTADRGLVIEPLDELH